ncbi:MAG: hypothetical protein AAF539_10310 [Planctomycetota bacterium]
MNDAIEDDTVTFALVHHVVGPNLERDVGDHFDWLLGDSDKEHVPTWSSMMIPRSLDQSIPGCWLPDHRRHYLTYEGPVGRDRGHVNRVAWGRGYKVKNRDPDTFLYQLTDWTCDPSWTFDWPPSFRIIISRQKLIIRSRKASPSADSWPMLRW